LRGIYFASQPANKVTIRPKIVAIYRLLQKNDSITTNALWQIEEKAA
jgi:hypothetical protein